MTFEEQKALKVVQEMLSNKVEQVETNSATQSITAIVVLAIVSFVLDLLCNQFEFLYRYSIISYALTMVSVLAICYKAFDYILSEINFFENWKGSAYEVPAKAFIVGIVLYCITILLQSAGSTDTAKSASPSPPARIEIVNKTSNSQTGFDSLETEDKRATER
jgi:hypothetical protein